MDGMSNPPDMDAKGNADALREYWTTGPGGIAIGWGTPGDFLRCVNRVNKYMSDRDARGFCNERHQDALGVPPGQE